MKVGIIALVVIIILLVLRLVINSADLTPEEVAQNYVNDNVDKLGEDIVGLIVGDNWLLTELGGEYIEDRVHDVIKWEFSTSRNIQKEVYEVIATAHVSMTVDYPILARSFNVDASVPFILKIDMSNKSVTSVVDILGVNVEHDLPLTASIPDVSETANKIKGLLDRK